MSTNESIRIEGRTRFSKGPVWEIEFGEREDRITLVGADLNTRSDGTFNIDVMHMTATDVEHDAAYIAKFEGAGLVLDYTSGHTLVFNGAIWKAAYWLPGEYPETSGCDDDSCGYAPHPIGPYLPPKRKIKPRVYRITMTPVFESTEQ